ncbi:hypothetical protein TSMEX_010865 [Taenia solium]|eukprot:TsM_000969700 transcript=TsM_000969700 gene=TsM_000969700
MDSNAPQALRVALSPGRMPQLSHAKMATECPELDSRQASVQCSSSKSFKGIARIFKPDLTKTYNMKIRIPSFRENRKQHSSTQQQRQVLQEPENLLKEIPALDFQKLKADLYVDLAYTNNLLRQRVHRDNLTNLVAQITECLRLIRCRVATAAAYIQTDGLPTLPTSTSASNVASGAAAFRLTTTASKPERHYYRRVHSFHPFFEKKLKKRVGIRFSEKTVLSAGIYRQGNVEEDDEVRWCPSPAHFLTERDFLPIARLLLVVSSTRSYCLKQALKFVFWASSESGSTAIP